MYELPFFFKEVFFNHFKSIQLFARFEMLIIDILVPEKRIKSYFCRRIKIDFQIKTEIGLKIASKQS